MQPTSLEVSSIDSPPARHARDLDQPVSHPELMPKATTLVQRCFHLIAIVLVLMSIGVYVTLSIRRGVPCSGLLPSYIAQRPNLTYFVVSVVASFVAAFIFNGFVLALQSVARKRVLEFRTILEIEVWSAFAWRSTMITWELKWEYWKWTAVTGAAATLFGLIPAGLVSLFTPIRVNVSENLSGLSEFDLSAGPPSCGNWYGGQLANWRNMSCTLSFPQLDLPYQDCHVQNQLLGVLEAAKGSMLAHVRESFPSAQNRSYVPNLPSLGDMQILGSTAGVLLPALPSLQKYHSSPFQPDIKYFFSRSPPYLANPFYIDSQLARAADYSLVLQGVWTEVSCQYSGQPGQNISWPHGSDPFQFSAAEMAGSGNDNIWTYNLYSCSNDCGQPVTGSNTVYAGIGSMTCTVKPRLQNLHATFLTSVSAFNITPVEGKGKVVAPNQPTELFRAASSLMRQAFAHARNDRHGDLIASLISVLAVSRYQLPKDLKHERYPGLVASMIKGIFEYQVSLIRLRLETSSNQPPQECRRSIPAKVQYATTGWDAQPFTVIPLLPLTFAALVLISSAIYVLRSKGRLTWFVPINGISLITAASAGGVKFSPEAICDPEDEGVRFERVKYGKLTNGKWGLIRDPSRSGFPTAEIEKPMDNEYVGKA